MILRSLISSGHKLTPVELELTLVPGLPQIQILGLPDQLIRESTGRVKCALKKQGFEFPKAQQILINLRPSHLRKSSKGIEFAIAVAYLWETQQLEPPEDLSNILVYGELTLEGQVHEPEDLSGRVEVGGNERVLTGSSSPGSRPFGRMCVSELKGLTQPEYIQPAAPTPWHRPSAGLNLSYTSEQARLIELFALAPFHVLLAGPSGRGKTTLARNLTSFLDEPPEECRQIWNRDQTWWPWVAPHASVTMSSLIAGGRGKTKSELEEVQHGFILLDELLEFKKEVLESLRSPLDGHDLLISRVGFRKSQSSQFVCVATTNLCPCGDWTPFEKTAPDCRFSAKKCVSYCERLSGPLLDRFNALFILQSNEKESVRGTEILKKLESVRAWLAEEAGFGFNLENSPASLARLDLLTGQSRRKLGAVQRLMKTCALLDMSPEIKPRHFDEAHHWSIEPFELLKKRQSL